MNKPRVEAQQDKENRSGDDSRERGQHNFRRQEATGLALAQQREVKGKCTLHRGQGWEGGRSQERAAELDCRTAKGQGGAGTCVVQGQVQGKKKHSGLVKSFLHNQDP